MYQFGVRKRKKVGRSCEFWFVCFETTFLARRVLKSLRTHIYKDDDYVLWLKGSKQYVQNKGLDFNGDGKISVGEATQKVKDRMNSFEIAGVQ